MELFTSSSNASSSQKAVQLVTACSTEHSKLLNTSDSKSISSFSYFKPRHKIVSIIMYTESEILFFFIISKYVLQIVTGRFSMIHRIHKEIAGRRKI